MTNAKVAVAVMAHAGTNLAVKRVVKVAAMAVPKAVVVAVKPAKVLADVAVAVVVAVVAVAVIVQRKVNASALMPKVALSRWTLGKMPNKHP
jgi:hypothetical protein